MAHTSRERGRIGRCGERAHCATRRCVYLPFVHRCGFCSRRALTELRRSALYISAPCAIRRVPSVCSKVQGTTVLAFLFILYKRLHIITTLLELALLYCHHDFTFVIRSADWHVMLICLIITTNIKRTKRCYLKLRHLWCILAVARSQQKNPLYNLSLKTDTPLFMTPMCRRVRGRRAVLVTCPHLHAFYAHH